MPGSRRSIVNGFRMHINNRAAAMIPDIGNIRHHKQGITRAAAHGNIRRDLLQS